MEHSELVAEMAQVEHLSTADRLQLARLRRLQQLKIAKQKEKEWMKSQSRRDRAATLAAKKQRHITFESSVVVLEAAARNDIEEVGRLLDLGVSPDATNEDGLTPLHQCCIDNNADMLRLLLDFGAAVNAKDSEKWTPLHAAATCGHLLLVKILIARGANLLAVNVDGNMPYDLCDDEETLDCIEAEMSKRGVTQELIDETRAATENQMLVDLVDFAARGGDLETPDKHGASPLHIAAANGYSKVVEFLLEHQACVDSVDKDLWTPVHAAACWGHMEVLEMLAMSGADLNARNKNEETPSDICEDAEIRERIEQLKTEQESKRAAEAQRRRVRRSQSNNTRAQSVRRTSLRDKMQTAKKDLAEETRLWRQAQAGYTAPDSTTEPSSIASDVPDSASTAAVAAAAAASSASSVRPLPAGSTNPPLHQLNHLPNGQNGHHHQHHAAAMLPSATLGNGSNDSGRRLSNQSATGRLATGSGIAYAPQLFDSAISRRSPDGKDNDAYVLSEELKLNGGGGGGGGHNNNTLGAMVGKMGNENNISAEIFSTSQDNGKINVQVTVLVGTTLANLKKQRAQSRTSTTTTSTTGSSSGSSHHQPLDGASNSSGTSSAPISASQITSTAFGTGIGQQRNSLISNRSSVVSNSNSSQCNNGNGIGAAGSSSGVSSGVVGSSSSNNNNNSSSSHQTALNGTSHQQQQPLFASNQGHSLDVSVLTTTTTTSTSSNNTTTSAISGHRGTEAAMMAPAQMQQQPKITKFSGVTSDVVSDSTSRRCCVIM